MKLKMYLALLAMGMLSLQGCNDDDDDLPDVNLSITFNNAVADGSVIYVVKETPLEITSITATGNGSKALVTSATYYWDNFRVGWSPIAPFNAKKPASRPITSTKNRRSCEVAVSRILSTHSMIVFKAVS